MVKIQKITILTSPLLFEAQIGIDLCTKKAKNSGHKVHMLCAYRIFAEICPFLSLLHCRRGNQRVSRFGLGGYYRFSGFKENVGSSAGWLLQTFYRRGQCQSVRGVGGASGTIGFEELINFIGGNDCLYFYDHGETAPLQISRKPIHCILKL